MHVLTGGTFTLTPNLIPYQIIPKNNLYSLQEIGKSPIILTVLSNQTYGQTSECFGDGLFRAKSGVESFFSCCPRDFFGNFRDDGNNTELGKELIFASMNLVGDNYIGGSGPDSIDVPGTYDAQIGRAHV